ncbi:MAG: ribosome silencing factor [Gammaproteobacteria bacterium]|nr:ribosome silencing factor [Gammaproteobacteria bacterium]
MQTKELQELATEALHDLKAQDLTAIDVHEMTSITDVMIICTGRSTRHVTSLAQNVATTAKQHKVTPVRMEGEREGEWVIVDLGDVVVHVMLPETRAYYHLEDLWEPILKQRAKQD